MNVERVEENKRPSQGFDTVEELLFHMTAYCF